jgi:hypothetical protein
MPCVGLQAAFRQISLIFFHIEKCF